MGCLKLTYYQPKKTLKVVHNRMTREAKSEQSFLSVDPLAEQTMTPYQYTYQNPIKYTDPTGMKGEIVQTDYVNKKTGEKIHVADNKNQVVEIDDALWFAAKELAQSGVNNSSEENINNYLMSTGDKVSSNSVSFSSSDVQRMMNFMENNISTPRPYVDKGGKKYRCLGQICLGTNKLYDKRFKWGAAAKMDLPGNPPNKNNMNKSMQYLIDLGLASSNQIFFPGDMKVGQMLYDRTTPNSFSVWGLSFNTSYHSITLIMDRTGGNFKLHYFDQNTHMIFNSASGFDSSMNKYQFARGMRYPGNHNFTQYKK